MSDCMTLDAFAAEEKYPNEDLESSKDIARSILNETLHSIVGSSEKVSDSNHIGDCNIGEEFLQYIPLNPSQSALRKVNETSEEKTNQLEDKPREYKVIEKNALTDSELRIQNCKVHLEAKGSGNTHYNIMREEACSVNEIQNRVSDPGSENKVLCENLIPNFGENSKDANETEEQKEESTEVIQGSEKPFTPLTTEDLRESIVKVWKNINNSVLNGLDGELSNQPQRVMSLIEDLSTLKTLPEAVADPNRPRACTLVEEDVKKMIKEIGEMNFNATVPSFETIVSCSRKENDQEEENSDENSNKSQKLNLTEDDSVKSNRSSTHGEEGQQEKTVQSHENASVLYAQSVPQFKSQKFNNIYELEGNEAMFTMPLTESDEAFIEASESVIQIIEPKEDSNDENEDKVTFSLLNESDAYSYQKDKDLALNDYDQLTYGSKERLDIQEVPKVRSGMTTVGPVKNINYDPKALTGGPEVDYGKMTKIRGSREMKKDSATDSLSSTESKKIYIDDGDDSPVIFFENGYMEFETIVNHDIASMTKVQKVKEVLSDQPKSDENFKGEEKLLRSPLDLKDVDAYSCESYNVLDLGVQLLTVDEVERSNSKELDRNSDTLLHGSNITNVTGERDERNDYPNGSTSEKEKTILENSRPISEKEQEGEETTKKNIGKELKSDDHHQISPGFSCNKSVTQVNVNQNQKHNTISRVFQKASNRFIMKDSDSFLRNSKSLPRDTSKITNTESFKSLLDDCQTSAVGVLKKSRSLVRNTQNVLKAVSKIDFGHTISGDKKVNASSDVTAEQTERRQSTSYKNNGFLKLKETIRNKVGKKLKSFENITTSDAKVTGNDRDSSENMKKPPPKSLLVCTNQIIQPCEEKKMEYGRSATVDGIPDVEEETQNSDAFTGMNEETDIEVICGVKFQGNSRCASHGSQSDSITDQFNDTNSDQIDYVVMETVKGLDEENIPDSLDASRTTGADGKLTQNNTGAANRNIQNREPQLPDEFSKIPGDKNLTMPLDRSLVDESMEELTGKEGNDIRKSISTEKLRRKNKNLSARIRSFWQTAFGKVKTSPRKDVS